jgi:hypothetical protein
MIIRPYATKLKTPGSQGDNDPLSTIGCMTLSAQTYPIERNLTYFETEGENPDYIKCVSDFDRLPAKKAPRIIKRR